MLLCFVVLFHHILADQITFTIDGENDCSDSGNSCTSLSQATESILKHLDSYPPDSTYSIVLAVSTTDSTERPITVNYSIAISEVGEAIVSISSDTTATSVFMTMGVNDSVLPIAVSLTRVNFSIHATGSGKDIVSGNLFKVDPTARTLLSLTLSSLTIKGDNPLGYPAVSTVAIIDMAHGTLRLNAVTMLLISIMNEALIKVTGGSIYTGNHCVIEEIHSYNQEDGTVGGALSAVLVSNSVLDVQGTIFQSCSSIFAGGAINVIALEIASITIGGMQYNSEVIFRHCSSMGYGGAVSVRMQENFLAIFNRIEYVSCNAAAGTNLYYAALGFPNLTLYIMQMDELLKGQIPQDGVPYDFFADITISPDPTADLGQFPLYFLYSVFAYILNISQTASGECEVGPYPFELPFDLGADPGFFGDCPSLKAALELTDQSGLPCGNTIYILPTSNLQPSNFTGETHRSVSILGFGNTVSLGLTDLLTEPMLTIGPGHGWDKDPRDRLITASIKETTFTIERTDAVYLRQPLFKIDNHWEFYNDDETVLYETRISTAQHYFELNHVNLISGNEYSIGIDAINPAVSITPLVECQAGTLFMLKYVTVSNMKFITSTDLSTGTTKPSLFSSGDSTLVILGSTFTNITLEDSPLFDANPRPADFGFELPSDAEEATSDNINTFENIVRIKGDGAIISVGMATAAYDGVTTSLAITNAYFEKCTCQDGNGGVVYLSSLDHGDQVIIDDLLFSGCSAQLGNNMYVATDSVTASELADAWNVLDNEALMNNDFQVKTGVNAEVPIFDHNHKTDVMMVDVNRGNDGGTADGQCGTPATIPCKTIYMAYTNRLQNTLSLALAAGHYDADVHPITIISSIDIIGAVSSPTFVIKPIKTVSGGVFVIPDSLTQGSVKFSLLTFELVSEKLKTGAPDYPASQLASPIISSSSPATLSLVRVNIEMADVSNSLYLEHASVTSALIVLTAGSLLLDTVECRSIMFDSGAPFLSSDAGTHTTLRTCTFEDITLQTRNLISTSSKADELTFEGTNVTFNVFQNIHRLSGHGAVLSIEVGGDKGLNLEYCSFVNCTTDETETTLAGTINSGYAGAIYLTLLSGDGVFTYDPKTVTFSLTTSPDTYVGPDGETAIPYFDASYNAPWKSAITFATTRGPYLGDTMSGYIPAIMAADPEWNAPATIGKYQVFILDDSEHRAYNNTLLYAVSNNLGGSTTSIVTPTGGDLPGCGLSDETAIPCASVQYAFDNLHPSSVNDIICLGEGTHRSWSLYNTLITTSVNISGTFIRALSKTFITVDQPSFITNTSTGPVLITQLTITLTSGAFVVNYGPSGFHLSHLTITGITHPTTEQRLLVPLLTSITGPVTLSNVVCKTITVKDCLFTNFADGTVTISDCSFASIVGRSPGTGGTVVSTLVTTAAGTFLKNTSFTGCTSQKNGGALAISIRTVGVISLNTVDFVNCSAVGNGGSIYIFASQKFSSLSLDNVVFSGATGDDPAATAAYGSYMFYQSDTLSADMSYPDCEAIVKSYRVDIGQFMVNQSTGEGPQNMYELQLHIRIGGENNTDTASCGSDTLPCRSLVSAFNCDIFSGDCYLFYLAPTVIPPADWHIRIHRNLLFFGLTQDGSTSTIQICSVPDSVGITPDGIPTDPEESRSNPDDTYTQPLFLVLRASWLWGTLQLNMTNIVYSVVSSSATPNDLRNPFLRASGDTSICLDTVSFTTAKENPEMTVHGVLFAAPTINVLELSDCNFHDLVLAEDPVFKLPTSPGYVDVKTDSTFANITRNKGNGAVIEETIDQGKALTLSRLTFESCICEDGNGGAAAFLFKGGRLVIGAYEDEETGEYDTTLFVNCSASGVGGAVYFEFDCLTAPAVADEDEETPADNLFLLQHVLFTGTNDMSRGKQAYAVGKKGVVDDITLWKYLIPLSTQENEYQYFISDEQDEEDALKDIFTIVPSVVTVNPFREDGDYCSECNTIKGAMTTFASFATYIILDCTWRDANLNTSLFHDVTIVGVSLATWINIPSTNDDHDVYFVVNVPRTSIILKGWCCVYNATDREYANHVRFLAVDNGAAVTFDMFKFQDREVGQNKLKGNVIDARNGKLTLIDCSFNTITLDSASLLGVSPKHGCFSMSGRNLFNTIRQSNSTFYTGGTILTVTLEGGDGIHIAHSDFSACTSATSGALLHLTILDEPDEGSISFVDNAFFAASDADNSTAPVSPPAGHSVNAASDTIYAIVVTSLTSYVQTHGSLWTSLMNGESYPSNSFVWLSEAIPENSNIPITLLTTNDLADYRYYTFYVDPSSTVDDNTQCEQTSLCPYLHYAADLSNKAAVEDCIVSISAGTLNNEQIRASFLRSCDISGTVSDVGRETTFAVSLEGTGLLSLIAVGVSKSRNTAVTCTFKDFLVTVRSVTNSVPYVPPFGVVSQFDKPARLVLDTISFSVDLNIPETVKHVPLETPLIAASFGCLTLINVDMTGFVLNDFPLIRASPTVISEDTGDYKTDLEFRGTNSFTNITRNVGYGGVFHFDMTDHSHLVLANSTYSTNSANKGGCIYINITQNIDDASYTWDRETLSFQIPGTFDEGAFIYIYSEQSKYIDTDYLQLESDLVYYQADLKGAYALELQTGTYHDVYQFYEVHEIVTNEVLIVSDDPAHYSDLSEAVNAFYADETARRIFLKRNLDVPPPSMNLTRDLSVSGLFDDRTPGDIPILGQTETLYTVIATTTSVSVNFNDLTFHLTSTPETPIAAALFATTGDLATIITSVCSFKPGEGGIITPLTAHIYNIVSGTLGLSKCQFTNIAMDNTPIIGLPSILVNFGVYSPCTFTNITRSSGSGAVFEETVDAADTLKLMNMVFINCKTYSGNGGAIYITLRFRSGLNFEGLTFTNCSTSAGSSASVHAHSTSQFTSFSSSNAGRRGGAVYIELAGKPDGWTITDTQLQGCSADEGRSFFFDASLIDPPTDTYWHDLLQNVEGATEGDVVALLTSNDTTSNIDLYQFTIRTTTSSSESSGDEEKNSNSIVIIIAVLVSVVIITVALVLIILACRRRS